MALSPVFFKTQAAFRKWFIKNHQKANELLVGFYKTGSGKESITWPQSVEEALCFGWIDGVRKSIDKESYCIRFTPRKPGSIWSAVNINKVEELTHKGLMQAAGLAIFEKRMEHRSRVYSHEKEPEVLSKEFEKTFKSNKKAWEFFQSLAVSYRKPALNWVMGAKQESTRVKRLHELIADSEQGKNRWKDLYKKNKRIT